MDVRQRDRTVWNFGNPGGRRTCELLKADRSKPGQTKRKKSRGKHEGEKTRGRGEIYSSLGIRKRKSRPETTTTKKRSEKSASCMKIRKKKTFV